QFGDRGAFAHPEFAAAVAKQIEHGDALGDARGVVGGELEDAVAEPDVFGALAGGGEEGFRRRRMRIFLQKMMFHYPGMVIAAAVGGLQLRQRILVELEFGAFLPRARQLQLIKDAELHDVSPAIGSLFSVECIRSRARVQRSAIPRYGRPLVPAARMVSFAVVESRSHSPPAATLH